MNRLSVVVVAAALTLCMIPSAAQQVKEKLPPAKERGKPAGPVPSDLYPAVSEQVLIPELTEVPVLLRDALHTGYTSADSEVLYFVARDIFGPNHTLVVPAGTSAVGHVVRSTAPRSFGVAGYLYVTCDYILAQDKTRIPLRRTVVDARGRDTKLDAALAGIAGGVVGAGAVATATKNGLAIGAGALLGPVVAAFVPGKDRTLPRGSTFYVSVDSDTAIAAPTPISAQDLPDMVAVLTAHTQDPDVLPRRAFVRLKDASYAFGTLNRAGNILVVTNSTETKTIRMSEVMDIQYYRDGNDAPPRPSTK